MSSKVLDLKDLPEAIIVEEKLWQHLRCKLSCAKGDVGGEVAIMQASFRHRLLKLKKLHQWLFDQIKHLTPVTEESQPEAKLMIVEMFSFERYKSKILEVYPTFTQAFLWQHWTSARSALWNQEKVYVSAADEDIFGASSTLVNDLAPGECVCGAPVTSKCGRCQCVGYCSRVCQKIAWPTHKKTCRSQPQAPSASAAAGGGAS